jgi:hypothetical protein
MVASSSSFNWLLHTTTKGGRAHGIDVPCGPCAGEPVFRMETQDIIIDVVNGYSVYKCV